jgi:phospholipid transport system substrate-binding protein
MLVTMLTGVGVSVGWAGTANDQLRTDVDEVFRILDDPTLKEPAHRSDRRAAIQNIIEATVDFREVARHALGRYWLERTPAEREEFIVLFTGLVERSYLSKLDLYAGDKLVYLGEHEEDDRTVVRTRVISSGPQGNESFVDFHMMRGVGDRWRVHDVVVDGASLTENYRTQFNTVLRRSSYSDLVKKIRSIAAEPK